MPAIARSTDSSTPLSCPPPGAPLVAPRILVVEDDPMQRELLCAVLRDFGVRHIACASDGWAALDRLDAAHCELVVCDLALPCMDGIEFLQRAASCGVGAFAIMSAADADVQAAVQELLLESGARLVELLPKPLAPEAVGRLLQRLAQARPPACDAPRTSGAPAADAATLKEALRTRAFLPFYQPQVAADSGELLGVEVLARWRRPGGEILPPSAFIPAMEQSSLIDRLSYQLIEQALADAACWNAGPLSISINLTPHTLSQASLPGHLESLARLHGIAPGRITLELTETAMAHDPQPMRACAARLRLRGFRLAIDDVGIGYSSLALLLGLPFTELKVDRSVVARLSSSRKARTLMEALLALGRQLGMAVVAEGVEDGNTLHLLRALGCPAVQGFHIARPMAQAELRDWLAAMPVSPQETSGAFTNNNRQNHGVNA